MLRRCFVEALQCVPKHRMGGTCASPVIARRFVNTSSSSGRTPDLRGAVASSATAVAPQVDGGTTCQQQPGRESFAAATDGTVIKTNVDGESKATHHETPRFEMDGPRYEGELKEGKPHGTGVLTYADGAVHRGEFADGVPHGAGQLTVQDGSLWSGTWHEGKPHGCIKRTTKDSVREVEYVDGVAAPRGTVTTNGRRYEGEMKHFQPHGTGVLTFSDGRIHRGEFADGVPHGAGQLTSPDGIVLSGTWREGERHGCMTMTTKDLFSVVEYVDGVAAPTGTVTTKDGRRYEGEMKDFNPHGTGVLTFSDGRMHRGESANGAPHGRGQMCFRQIVVSGTWRAGNPHGHMTATAKSYRSEVEYVDGVAAPTGTVTAKDGGRYEGEIKNWKPHGKGMQTFSDGRIHRGEFADGVPHGPGQQTLPDGAVLSGTWRAGKPHGCMKLTTQSFLSEVEFVDGVAAPAGTVKYNDGDRYEGEMEDFQSHGKGVLTYADGQVYRGVFFEGAPAT